MVHKIRKKQPWYTMVHLIAQFLTNVGKYVVIVLSLCSNSDSLHEIKHCETADTCKTSRGVTRKVIDSKDSTNILSVTIFSTRGSLLNKRSKLL